MVASTKPQQKRKVKGSEEKEIRSSLFILDLKGGKFYDWGEVAESKTFHKLHVFGMNDDLWDRVIVLGNETWKGCE